MIATLPVPLSETETRLEVSVSAELGVSADEARRKLTRYFMEHVTMFIGACRPAQLIINAHDDMVWRFNLDFGMANTGNLGIVGQADVDALTGDILLNDEKVAEITQYADQLAQRATHSARG